MASKNDKINAHFFELTDNWTMNMFYLPLFERKKRDLLFVVAWFSPNGNGYWLVWKVLNLLNNMEYSPHNIFSSKYFP